MIGFRALIVGIALLGFGGTVAQAQYYAPPGYPRPFGLRCRARVQTPAGPQTIICPMQVSRRVGAPCNCPPPPPPPGYAYGPPLRGRIIP